MVYKIFISKENLAIKNKVKETSIKHKFLYESLEKDIKCFEDSQINYYNFFDTVYFVVVSSNTKEEVDKIQIKNLSLNDCIYIYYGYYFKEEISNNEISKALRNSSTLEINEKNSFETKNMRIVFAEKGFAFCQKRDKYDLSDNLERILFLFLLSQAYNSYSETIIDNVAIAHSNNNYKEMIKIRDDIYSFDVRCFFRNPIKQNRYETFNLWEVVSKNYYVKHKYEEVKSQISDLANIIEIKQETIKNEKDKKFEKLIALVGIVLAATSLLGFYLDLKELGLF